VNAFTVHLAKVLCGSPIKVNSAHPGSVKTDMNPTGDLTVEEGRGRLSNSQPWPMTVRAWLLPSWERLPW
jgi:NAD(P)-dependent dehydrogenase (short-subunit alcohol dehydrogenase family)